MRGFSPTVHGIVLCSFFLDFTLRSSGAFRNTESFSREAEPRGLEVIRRVSWVLIFLFEPGCLHLERTEPLRPPSDLPASWVEPYRPSHPGFNLRLELGEDGGGSYECHHFFFDTYSELDADFSSVEGRFYRTLEVPPGERAPLLLISPILGGAFDNYLACRVFSWWACAEGISTFYLHQEENILSGDRDGIELERLTRGNIRDNIRALDLFLQRADVDPLRVGSLGISLGAIKNVVLMAVEPRLSANVLCMGGADLGKILILSQEGSVLRYLEQRGARDSMTREEICAEVRRNYKAEPGRFAESIASDRVLLFLGSLDNKVPYKTGKALREKLGEPETYILPLGHYTAILAAPFAAGKMFSFLKRRFGRPREGQRPALDE